MLANIVLYRDVDVQVASSISWQVYIGRGEIATLRSQ